MLNRRSFVTAAAAGALATLAAPALIAGRAGAAEAKKLRIGWQKNGVLALAKSQGALEKRFADRGVEVSWAEFSSGPPLLEALGAGALDFGPTGDVPPLFAQAAGGNLLYVGTYAGSPAGSAILVHAGLGHPGARRPQGPQARLQARVERPQLRGQGPAQGWVDARRRRGGRPRAAGCARRLPLGGRRRLGDLGSLLRGGGGRPGGAGADDGRGNRAVVELLPRQRRLHRGQRRARHRHRSTSSPGRQGGAGQPRRDRAGAQQDHRRAGGHHPRDADPRRLRPRPRRTGEHRKRRPTSRRSPTSSMASASCRRPLNIQDIVWQPKAAETGRLSP